MMRHVRVRAGVAVTLVGLTLGAASCGQPSRQYVRNADQRTAFAVPQDWTVFEERDLLGGVAQAGVSTPDPRLWLVGFDASPDPSVDHVVGADPSATDHPTGIAGVFRLDPQQRDQINLSALRNMIFPIDSIIEQVGQDAVEVLVYDDRLVHEGFRGIHIEFQVLSSAVAQMAEPSPAGAGGDILNDTYLHVSQTAYFDEATDRVFVIAVMCDAECFARYRGDIESVVESWTVLP